MITEITKFNFQITFLQSLTSSLLKLSNSTPTRRQIFETSCTLHQCTVPWMSGTLHVSASVALEIYHHHPTSFWGFSSFSLSLFRFEVLIAAMNSKDEMGETTIFQLLNWHNLIVSHRIMKWKLKCTLVDDWKNDGNQALCKNIIIRVGWVVGLRKIVHPC